MRTITAFSILSLIVILLAPLEAAAQRKADPGAWEFEDLPFAVVMIAAVGLAFESALRLPPGWAYRAGVALAAAVTFLLTWGNLAVGFAGSEDNAINLVFFAVPAVAVAGAFAARFRPAGMALAMAAAAAAQCGAGLVAWIDGYFTGPLTVAFAGLWLASSLLFYRAAEVRGTA